MASNNEVGKFIEESASSGVFVTWMVLVFLFVGFFALLFIAWLVHYLLG